MHIKDADRLPLMLEDLARAGWNFFGLGYDVPQRYILFVFFS